MSSDRVVLGTAALGLNGREAAFEILDEYVRLGGRTIDTAAIYSDWVPGETRRSEGVIGEWLKARSNRDELYIITKGAHPMIGSTQSRLDPASIRTDVDQSLERLGVDEIDLYLLHKHDPKADVPADRRHAPGHPQGRARSAPSAAPTGPSPRMNEALAVPGVTFTANQVLGNVFARLIAGPPDPTNLAIDAEMFRHALDNGLDLYLYSATAHGYFERRAAGQGAAREYQLPAIEEAAAKLEALAAEAGVQAVRDDPRGPAATCPAGSPIIGASSVEQLRQSWKGGETRSAAGASCARPSRPPAWATSSRA